MHAAHVVRHIWTHTLATNSHFWSPAACTVTGCVLLQVSAEWHMKPNPAIAPPDTYIGMAGVSEVILLPQLSIRCDVSIVQDIVHSLYIVPRSACPCTASFCQLTRGSCCGGCLHHACWDALVGHQRSRAQVVDAGIGCSLVFRIEASIANPGPSDEGQLSLESS